MIAALTGFMASGKTTFGRAAARQIGWAFIDLDERISERYGTPAELFATEGEARFRQLETQMLAETLLAQGDTVVALGGGTALKEENLRLIKTRATLIWLDTDFEIILSELGNTDRPLLHGLSREQVRALYDERRPRYAAAADLVFPVLSFDYDKVIGQLAAFIQMTKSLSHE